MKTALVATAITACLTLAVHAQGGPDAKDKPSGFNKGRNADALTENRRVAERAFKRADKDKDESLTKEEFRKAAPSIATDSIIDKRFTELDRNKDGCLALDEFKSWNEQALRREAKRDRDRSRDRKGDGLVDPDSRRAKEPKGDETTPTPPAPPRAE